MIFTDLSGSKIEDNMTPKFNITTPNGKTIEGYDFDDLELRCNSWCSDCRAFDWGYCLRKYNTPKGTQFKLSDITEEQAKEWGYEEKDLSEMEDGLFFTAKDVFVLAVTNEIKVTEVDLSNILLTLIEE